MIQPNGMSNQDPSRSVSNVVDLEGTLSYHDKKLRRNTRNEPVQRTIPLGQALKGTLLGSGIGLVLVSFLGVVAR